MFVIVNYGIGNLDSVCRAFKANGAESVVSDRPEDVGRAEGLVLPGVGSFAQAMQNLRDEGLIDVLNQRVVQDRIPVLGICLGMQMFTQHSQEGDAAGLGWIDGETKRFEFAEIGARLPIPHMGWNELDVRKQSPLLEGIAREACFYFAHSYCVTCRDPGPILAATQYGYEFVSAVHQDNIFGVQFHPEKSHANGVRLVRNFIQCCRHA